MLKVNHNKETAVCAECGVPLFVLGLPNFSSSSNLPHFNDDGTIRMRVSVVCKQCGAEIANHWLVTEGE